MISVLIASDQSLQRHGLRMLLAGRPDLTVVGEARGGAEAVRLAAVLRPDVVLLDGRVHETEGPEVIRRITRPAALAVTGEPVLAARVLVLTPTSDEGHAYAALRAGAGGFLPQNSTTDELIAAIRVVATGDSVITPHLTRALIDTVRQLQPSRATPEVGLRTLTERERDVLAAVASGWSNAEIAQRLSIAPTTVKSHVSHILAKIGARARVQAVAFAYESGLVRPAA
ncbi:MULTISPECIES: LuxR C-terminal-related transcriptional regulator [unclassified Streptomyces]|uniref:LuxR C-terminal-related transcriptional regulator n=1 Tax=unclassified Streptomyces TaxID=2593676 RepID=UPI0036E676C3